METGRPCGCKGIRSCLICETQYDIQKADLKTELEKYHSYVYCPLCNKSWPGWNVDVYQSHSIHHGDAIEFPGVYIQNFGPKCNFKKKKLRLGSFNGFPSFTRFVQDKFSTVPLLHDFQTIEQCTLEYDPSRGASIDPHIDDCWIWGERIVTVNVQGDSVLTMIPYRGPETRYNLKSIAEYSYEAYESLKLQERNNTESFDENLVVRLPMPEGSLIVLYGAARYKWEHCVLREDVKSRRICLAYRELTPPYLNNFSMNNEIKEILRRASTFR